MAAGNVAKVIRAPGRIVVGPTTAFATTDYPYGGTEIGKVKGCIWNPLGVSYRVPCEGLGEANDRLEATKQYEFSCNLRGWDDDAIRLLLSGGYEAGSVTQHAVFHEPGSVTPGQSALSRAVVLAYVPDDVAHVPALLIYHGIPDFSDATEVPWQHGEEFVVTMTVDCYRDSNDNILRVGRLPDLSLT